VRQLAEELDRSDYLHPLLQGLGSFHLLRSELKLALSLAQQIEEIGKTRNDAGMLLAGRTNQGIICFYSGQFVTAGDVLEQCYADPADRPAVRAAGATVSPLDLYSGMLVYSAMSLAYLGYVDAARARVREALSEASRLEHVYTLTHASLYAAWIECAVGSPYDIRDHAERAVSLASSWVSV
jgi:hypothetical protein